MCIDLKSYLIVESTGLHQERAYTCLGIFCLYCVHQTSCFLLYTGVILKFREHNMYA